MSRNLAIFLFAVFLGVGAILVYANSVKTKSTDSNSQTLGANINPVTPAESLNGGAGDIQGSQVSSQNSQNQNMQNRPSNQNSNQNQQVQANTPQNSSSKPTSLPPYSEKNVSELVIKDQTEGSGEAVKSGDTVEVNYIGTFLDGKMFDSSYMRNQTFSFQVGAGQVIRGWDEGLVGMKTGGKRLLVIPSDMAYGESGSEGSIPPNSPLMFEVQLVSIKPQ